VKHAEEFSKEAIGKILELDIEVHGDYLKKAFMVITIFTAMRVQDAHTLRSRGCSMVPATVQVPRHYKLILDQTKNDKNGTGPVDGRTYLLGCLCRSNLTDDKQKKAFDKDVRKSPNTDCWTACPFQVIKEYLAEIPDPFGQERELERVETVTLEPLPFFRAQHSVGKRQYLLKPLGKNMLSAIPKYINSRLPLELQVSNATGHSGRTTFITHAINSGTAPEVVAKASKHKDPKSLMQYHHVDANTLLAPSMTLLPTEEKGCESNANDDGQMVCYAGSGESYKRRKRDSGNVICDSDNDDFVPTSRLPKKKHKMKKHKKADNGKSFSFSFTVH
jgi:hypothetical protein